MCGLRRANERRRGGHCRLKHDCRQQTRPARYRQRRSGQTPPSSITLLATAMSTRNSGPGACTRCSQSGLPTPKELHERFRVHQRRGGQRRMSNPVYRSEGSRVRATRRHFAKRRTIANPGRLSTRRGLDGACGTRPKPDEAHHWVLRRSSDKRTENHPVEVRGGFRECESARQVVRPRLYC